MEGGLRSGGLRVHCGCTGMHLARFLRNDACADGAAALHKAVKEFDEDRRQVYVK